MAASVTANTAVAMTVAVMTGAAVTDVASAELTGVVAMLTRQHRG
jgi:hypothetical protein